MLGLILDGFVNISFPEQKINIIVKKEDGTLTSMYGDLEEVSILVGNKPKVLFKLNNIKREEN